MPMPMLISPSSSVFRKPRISAGKLDSMTWALKKVSSKVMWHPRVHERNETRCIEIGSVPGLTSRHDHAVVVGFRRHVQATVPLRPSASALR